MSFCRRRAARDSFKCWRGWFSCVNRSFSLSLFRLIVVPSRSHYSTRADEKKANGRSFRTLLSLFSPIATFRLKSAFSGQFNYNRFLACSILYPSSLRFFHALIKFSGLIASSCVYKEKSIVITESASCQDWVQFPLFFLLLKMVPEPAVLVCDLFSQQSWYELWINHGPRSIVSRKVLAEKEKKRVKLTGNERFYSLEKPPSGRTVKFYRPSTFLTFHTRTPKICF